jgi:hypothetical protein
MESEYYNFFHNKLVQNKIQLLYDNYKQEHNNVSPPLQYIIENIN